MLFAAVLPLLLAPGLGAERSERLYVNATLVVVPRSGAVQDARRRSVRHAREFRLEVPSGFKRVLGPGSRGR